MANMDKDLHLNFDENVLFYEVEKYDETDMNMLTDEEQAIVEDANNKFLAEAIEKACMSTFSICPCQMPEFIARNERKRTIMNIAPQAYQPTITQDDIDAYRFAVIVVSEHGFMKGVSSIIRECKKCHKIEYWGNAEIFAHLLAEITTNFIGMQAAEEMQHKITDVATTAENPLGANAVLTDIPEEGTGNLIMEDLPGDSDKIIDATELFASNKDEDEDIPQTPYAPEDSEENCNQGSPE